MKKLFIFGIASLIVSIAWMLYIHYDTKKFVQNLSDSSLTKDLERLDSVTKDSTVVAKNERTISDSGEQMRFPSSSDASNELSETEPDNTSKTRSNIVSGGDHLSTSQEVEDTKLLPELVTLFSEYNDLYQQSLEVSKVFSPLMTQHINVTQRMRKIYLEELVAATDEATKLALYDELNELKAWKEEVKPKTIELQEERQRISKARLNLLKTAGFSSREEFMNIHRDTYITWVSEQ